MSQGSSWGRWRSSGSKRPNTSAWGTTWPPSCRAGSPWSTATPKTTPSSTRSTGWNERETGSRAQLTFFPIIPTNILFRKHQPTVFRVPRMLCVNVFLTTWWLKITMLGFFSVTLNPSVFYSQQEERKRLVCGYSSVRETTGTSQIRIWRMIITLSISSKLFFHFRDVMFDVIVCLWWRKSKRKEWRSVFINLSSESLVQVIFHLTMTN